MKKLVGYLLFFFFVFVCYSQSAISYNGSGNYELVERSDLRRYDNGRYKGLVSREVSSFIIPVASDDGYLYDGIFYVLENTKREGAKVGFGLNEAIPAKFKISKNGELSMIEDNGFPSYRSFPTFPDSSIKIGDSWAGEAVRAVDPLYKGVVTRMPVYVQYTYTGDSVFNGESVFVISAKWATRYGMGTGSYYVDYNGDSELKKASGSHDATIYVSKKTGNSVLIRDNVDESFDYTDGNQIRFKGTVSLFTKYPPATDRMKFLPALKRIANLTDKEMEDLSKPVDKFPENSKDKNSSANNGSGSSSDGVNNGTDSGNSSTSSGTSGDAGSGNGSTADGVVDGTGSGNTGTGNGNSGTSSGSNGGAGSGNGGSSGNGSLGTDFEDDGVQWEAISGDYDEFINSGSGKTVAKNDKGSSKDELYNRLENNLSSGGSGAGTGSGNGSGSNGSGSGKGSKDDINIKVDNTPAGIRLTMENLQFLPDSAQLIPGQLDKLNEIAEMLKTVPNGRFLIEGHTASTGYEAGEMKLSIERAESIAREFVDRGLSKYQFICKGSGGKKPVADNSTYQGKAKNRRVEITILD